MVNCYEISFNSEDTNLTLSTSLPKHNITTSVINESFAETDFSLTTVEEYSDLKFDKDKRCPIILYENKEYWLYVEFNLPKEITSNNIFQIYRRSTDNKSYSIRFNSKSYVGILNLVLFNIHKPFIEVESKKIDYHQEYNSLLFKISEIGVDLTSRASSFFQIPVSTTENIQNNKELLNSKIVFIKSKILSGEIDRLYNVFFQKPTTRLSRLEIDKYIWEVDQIDITNYIDGLFEESIIDNNNRRIPLRILTEEFNDSIDTIENQFIKHLIELINQLLVEVNDQIKMSDAAPLKMDIEECLKRCELIITNPLFRKISKMRYFPSKSNVLQSKHPYKELYGIYMLLFYEIEITDDTLSTSMVSPLKDLPKLYEYYCYLIFVDILSTKFSAINLINEGLISYNQAKLCFNLNQSNSGLKFQITDSKFIKLYYGKMYNDSEIIYNGRSYSHELDPDISIELFIDENMVGIIHFDAKYKLEKSEKFKLVDIDKMHTYKDAILGSIGAYVLYPGKEIERFMQEENGVDNTDNIFPSVGAFTLNINDALESSEKLKILNIIDKFINIDDSLTSNGIFEQTKKSYNYLKRLID